MEKSCLLGAVCAGLFTLITTSTNAALVDNGGGLIYDDVLDITWAQPDTVRTLVAARTWVEGLTLGGVSGWRLPSMNVNGDNIVVDCSGGGVAGCADNEMGFLYWEEGITAAAPGPFSNVQSGNYWSDTLASSLNMWVFSFDNGEQSVGNIVAGEFYSWAVHSGNVVPVPAAVWLFGSGLVGLVAMARRKKAA